MKYQEVKNTLNTASGKVRNHNVSFFIELTILLNLILNPQKVTNRFLKQNVSILSTSGDQSSSDIITKFLIARNTRDKSIHPTFRAF